MKKINFLVFTALLCAHFTAPAEAAAAIAAAAAQVDADAVSTLTAAESQTYTFNYVTSTQSDDDQELQLSLKPYSFVLSPTLSDIVEGAEQAVFPGVDPDAVASGQVTIPPLYLYDGDGNLALEFDSLGAPINSWVPAASSTPIFFVSTSSDLLKADLMSLAAAANGVITVPVAQPVIADGLVESIGVSTNVSLTAAQQQDLDNQLTTAAGQN